MIFYKTKEEIELLRESSLLVGKTLAEVAKLIKPGVTTAYLDKIAEEFIKDNNAKPGFKGLYGCPSTLLCSVNEAVVHGLPSDRPLQNGDIVSIDCGVLKNGFYGDSAYTFEIGEVDPKTKKLLEVTKICLEKGIEQARVGNTIGDIGFAVQLEAEKNGFSVVRDLVGHGLGRNLHEKPEVPNFGKKGKGPTIQSGLVIAIEPMINMGKKDVVQLKDGWTIVTKDGKPSAHFEHDVAITDEGVDVLSTFKYIEEVLGQK
ncbi:MAG: type I methionyl aminopeptidase [Flavobacteriales bacterium]|nr:type I methionyl aminopeptidase [Flavobacteriales bacterium]MCB9198231.1 type I methionyl aminopeptidase [Flavobacteriales bacterium]